MNTIHAQGLDISVAIDTEVEQPNIAFLYVPDERPVFANQPQLSAWMQSFSELDLFCRATSFFVQPPPYNGTFQVVPEICQKITELYHQFDGFVIMLPRDQILDVSAILSLSITQTGKPIICTSDYATGMQTRFRDYHSVALKGDLVNVAHVAGSNIGTVAVMAGVEILHPALATVAYNDDRPFLTSATNKLMGVVDFGIHIFSGTPKRSSQSFQFENWNIDTVQRFVIDNHKLAAVKQKDFAVRSETHGLIAEIAGVAPLSLITVLPKHIPVLITSQAGAQLSIEGTVVQLHAKYTNQAVAAQFTRVIVKYANNTTVSLAEIVKQMQQQRFPMLTAGV